MKAFETHRCVTGSLRRLFDWHGHDVDEDLLLLGLGEGVEFIYWHAKGQPPFLGGRAQPKPSIEELAAQRLGCKLKAVRPSSETEQGMRDGLSELPALLREIATSEERAWTRLMSPMTASSGG